jgi:hypothetical protein
VLKLISDPVADMREKPDLLSKVVSQALFGEEIVVKERLDNWALISTPESYSGWIPVRHFVQRKEPYKGNLETSRLASHVYHLPDLEYGPILTLPHGSKLQEVDSSHPRWIEVVLPDGKKGFIQKGDVAQEPFKLASFAKKFLGVPYTWGGRSSFGFDCSGFAQMLYKRLGIILPRDSKDQFLVGREVGLDALEEGDLIFWGHSKEEIKHVGISLGGLQFIHTSSKENFPYLRVSQLTDFEWSGSSTYSFRVAKRLTR